jgi:hypothetical protein
MMAPLQSCLDKDSASINSSATDLGKLKAVLSAPKQPADCKVEEPHVEIPRGANPWDLLAKEGNQLNKQNARTRRCNGDGGVIDQLLATQERATQ